jgi:hypothetical protein
MELQTLTEQFGFDLGEPEKPAYVSSHSVRLELHEWLDAAKAATGGFPWNDATTRHYRNMFPIKAKVLPPEEARFLWRQFEMELDRIERELAHAS